MYDVVNTLGELLEVQSRRVTKVMPVTTRTPIRFGVLQPVRVNYFNDWLFQLYLLYIIWCDYTIEKQFYLFFAVFSSLFIDSSCMFLDNLVHIISHPSKTLRHPRRIHAPDFDNSRSINPLTKIWDLMIVFLNQILWSLVEEPRSPFGLYGPCKISMHCWSYRTSITAKMYTATDCISNREPQFRCKGECVCFTNRI